MINKLEDLRPLIGDFVDQIIEQSKMGDPDWVLDLIDELDHIKPTSTFFIEGFHGKLTHLKSRDFDLETIANEVLALEKEGLKDPIIQAKVQALESEEPDNANAYQNNMSQTHKKK